MECFYIPRENGKKRVFLENIQDIALPKGDFLTCQGNHSKWGLIDISTEGEVIWKIPPIFRDANSFSQGLWPCTEEKNWGFLNSDGNVVLEPKWDFALPFSQGLSVVSQEEKKGLINMRGEWVVPPRADTLRTYSDDVAVGRLGSIWFILNQQGKTVSTPVVDFLQSFSEGLAAANIGGQLVHGQLVIGGKWGFINKKGNKIIEPQFSWAGNFSGSHAPYFLEEFDEWGLVSRTGDRTPVRGVTGIKFVEGVEIIAEKEERWGVFSLTGECIIAPEYDRLYSWGKGGFLGFIES